MQISGLRNKSLVFRLLIRFERIGILQVVAIHPRGERGDSIAHQIARRVNNLAGLLPHCFSESPLQFAPSFALRDRPPFHGSFPQKTACSFETASQTVLKRGIALAAVDMLCNRGSNHFRYREIFYARDGLQSFRLVSGESDGHGFDGFHTFD